MSDHPIFQSKIHHIEKKKFTDSPIQFTTTATVLRDDLLAIRKDPDGKVITFDKLIDNFKSVEDYLKRSIASCHSLDGHEKYELNFLLSDIKISDIQTPDNDGGLVVAGSLAMPYIDGITYPTDENNGEFRKILDLSKPTAFALGKPHSFVHSLKHNNIGKEHVLVDHKSKTLPSIKYPDGKVVGKGDFAVEYSARDDGSLQVVPKGPIMMHGHVITNKSVYGDSEARPTYSEHLRPTSNDGVQVDTHVHVPPNTYQESWFVNKAQYSTSNGPVVPFNEYAQGTYDFLGTFNYSRPTNFHSSGIWFNMQYLKEISCLKFLLTFRIIPIVDCHEEGTVEGIPFANLTKHLKSKLKLADK